MSSSQCTGDRLTDEHIQRVRPNLFKPLFVSLRLLSPRRRRIFLFLALARVVVNGLDVLGLLAIGVLGAMLASGLTGRDEASFGPFVISVDSSASYFVVVVIIAGFFLTKSALSTALQRVIIFFLARLETHHSNLIATHIFSGDLSRVRSLSRGETLFAVGGSSTAASVGLPMAGSSILTEGVLFLSIALVFLFVDWSTALFVSLYFAIVVGTFQLLINPRLKILGTNISHNNIGMTNAIQDLSVAFREIVTLSRRPFFLDRFRSYRWNLARNLASEAFLNSLPRFVVESALMFGVLALIGWQFLRGNLTDGVVTTAVFLAGSFRMMAALLPLQSAVAAIKSLGPQAELAQRLLGEIREEEASEEGEQTPDSATGETEDSYGYPVSVDSVSFSYPDSDENVLQGVSITVPSGAFAAIVGPSGAGKTTMVDLLLGIYPPDSGTVLVNNESPGLVRRNRPGTISYVPQNPGIVSGTIGENIALGVPAEDFDEDTAWEALEKAQLADYVKSLPKGIKTNLGKQSDSLSGGQKQRLGLARALYTRPRLLVLDEATSAMDAKTEAGISSAIEQLGAATTVVVIAHRLSTIQNADVVFVMEQGTITAQGTFTEVRKMVPLIEEYVQLMAIGNQD